MHDKYAILIHRDVNHKKEYLLIRPTGETLLHFPIITQNAKESGKEAIKRGLKEMLSLEADHLNKVAVTGYQGPGVAYFSLKIYSAECINPPRVLTQHEALLWMSKNSIHEHIAQMSYLMQECILPCLDEEDVWL